jgi:hypothetical protein
LHTFGAQSLDCEGGGKRTGMRIAGRLGTISLVLFIVATSQGCVASEGSLYRRQLSRIVQPAQSPSDDIAIAFELDRQLPQVAVTAVRDQ